MKTFVKMTCATGLTLAIAGCQTVANEHDRPARIVSPDDASRAALQSVVDSVLNTHVTLADNALTDTSVLSIEHNPPRTMQNPNPQGRVMEPPFLFRLVVNGSDCILIDQRDRGRFLLENTTCEAE
jgi:hypothetical protein